MGLIFCKSPIKALKSCTNILLYIEVQSPIYNNNISTNIFNNMILINIRCMYVL